jgi:hypothetical protein
VVPIVVLTLAPVLATCRATVTAPADFAIIVVIAFAIIAIAFAIVVITLGRDYR